MGHRSWYAWIQMSQTQSWAVQLASDSRGIVAPHSIGLHYQCWQLDMVMKIW